MDIYESLFNLIDLLFSSMIYFTLLLAVSPKQRGTLSIDTTRGIRPKRPSTKSTHKRPTANANKYTMAQRHLVEKSLELPDSTFIAERNTREAKLIEKQLTKRDDKRYTIDIANGLVTVDITSVKNTENFYQFLSVFKRL